MIASTSGVGGGSACGCKCTLKSFDSVKIWTKSLKIEEKSEETWAKSVKTFANSLTI